MYIVMCVIDDASLLPDVLAEWRRSGIGGATYFQSSGMQRRLTGHLLIPQRFAFERQAEGYEEDHYTLFAVVPDEDSIQTCLHAAERIIGDFSLPDTGIFISWPLGFTKGITDKKRHKSK